LEPARLKEEFGDHVSFWGGVNSSRILPWGTPDQVREEVRRVIHTLGPGGGYILNSVHNIQPDVPLENFFTMFEAAREFGTYPLGTANSE
jgi:uroporphyrinogen decarboxylase